MRLTPRRRWRALHTLILRRWIERWEMVEWRGEVRDFLVQNAWPSDGLVVKCIMGAFELAAYCLFSCMAPALGLTEQRTASKQTETLQHVE